MQKILALALSGLMFGPASAQADAAPTDTAILAMGAYVPTDDIATSQAFYRVLFDRAPTIQLDDFVAFDTAGGWFAIVSRPKYAPNTVPGTGSVPYLQSAALEDLQARVAQTGRAVPAIIKEPGIHVLKITDPNGQLIEFFRLMGQ
ncbi:MAG: hypothetical protein AAGB05_11035 [Pseudomonadota bacterium]